MTSFLKCAIQIHWVFRSFSVGCILHVEEKNMQRIEGKENRTTVNLRCFQPAKYFFRWNLEYNNYENRTNTSVV